MEALGLMTPDGRCIAQRLLIARSFRDRLRGLRKSGELPPDTALMLSPCGSIHTFGLGFPIDAIFLNAQLRILRLDAHIAPWRVRWAPFGTRHVVELRAGTLDRLDLAPGTFLCLQPREEAPAAMAAPWKQTLDGAPHVRFSLHAPLRPPCKCHSSRNVKRNR